MRIASGNIQNYVAESEHAVVNGIEAKKVVLIDGLTGDVISRPNSVYAQKTTVVDTTTYIGIASPGTLQSEAKWQAEKIVVSGGTTTITWADSAKFTQIATDLTVLVYE